jgi:hypothetical protein
MFYPSFLTMQHGKPCAEKIFREANYLCRGFDNSARDFELAAKHNINVSYAWNIDRVKPIDPLTV